MIDQLCTALGDPTRRRIVEQLATGPASLTVLAAPHPMTLTAVSKHVAVLVGAGLVERSKQGRVVTCTLRPGPLDELDRWVADVRTGWGRALDRLDAAVRAEIDAATETSDQTEESS